MTFIFQILEIPIWQPLLFYQVKYYFVNKSSLTTREGFIKFSSAKLKCGLNFSILPKPVLKILILNETFPLMNLKSSMAEKVINADKSEGVTVRKL